MQPTLSVIIPTLNEATSVVAAVRSAQGEAVREVIVVDGGSTDETRDRARDAGATVVGAVRGRASQQNRGAEIAQGDGLVFLHADTRLEPGVVDEIEAALADSRVVGGGCRIRLEGRHRLLPAVSAGINLRTRCTRRFTGDQALFVRREVFERLGGFPDWPLMEDVALSRDLRSQGRVAVLRGRAISSGRRFDRDGVVATLLLMWRLRLEHRIGRTPEKLARAYGYGPR